MYKNGLVLGMTAIGLAAVIVLARRAKTAPSIEVSLSDLVITPEAIYPGETVYITLTATNMSQFAGSSEIVCEIG